MYATWDELRHATILADPDSKPLVATIYPPHGREKYMAMHIHGVGWTDVRRYRWGDEGKRRARSEIHERRMVHEDIALHFDLPLATVVSDGPEIAFEWSPLTWDEWMEADDE